MLSYTKPKILFSGSYCESTFKIKNGQWVLAGDSTAQLELDSQPQQLTIFWVITSVILIYLLFAYTYHQKSGNEEFSSKSKSYVDLY